MASSRSPRDLALSAVPRSALLSRLLLPLLLLALAPARVVPQETYDPDADLNTPQTIRRHGYPAEAHVVQTADGYLLTVHRIPGPRFSNATDGTPPAAAPGPAPDPAASRLPRSTGPSPLQPSASNGWTTTDATAAPAGTWTTTEHAPTNGTVGPWTSASPTTTARSEPTRPGTTTERPASNGTAPPWTTEATSPGTTSSRPESWTTAATNATTAPSAPTTAPPTSSTPTPTPFSPTSTDASTTSFPTTISNATYDPETSTIPTTVSPSTTTTTVSPSTTTTTAQPPLSRPVVFLQHGLLGSSYDWIVAGPGKGLAYLLADAGYDVWMGNARGNTYSRAHVYLPIESSSPFWDFSFHEMGIYDLPAVIDHILNTTGSPQLHYVGHSMGTTMFFVMASLKPEAAAGVASMRAMAPVVFVRHIKSPIRLLSPFAHDVEFLARLLGEGEFLPQNKILHYLAKYGCELLETEKDVCENLIFILCGFDKPQFDTSILPVLLGHTPAGASTRTLIHYAQMIKSGKFEQYDFGKYGNLKKYRSLVPPSYDLTKVNVSVHLLYANNDWLAATMDVNSLYEALHCTKSKYLVPLSSFNHLDFILAKDVKALLYDKILKDLPRDIDYQNYEDNFLYD